MRIKLEVLEGANKMAAIKCVRALSDMGLAQAKDFVESTWFEPGNNKPLEYSRPIIAEVNAEKLVYLLLADYSITWENVDISRSIRITPLPPENVLYWS